MATLKGGERLAAKLDELAQNLKSGGALKVGFLSGATYPDGTPVAMVAAIQEFGAPRASIPPRPFFRNMIAAKSTEWPAAIAGLLVGNGYDAHAALSTAGEAIAGQLRESIIQTDAPPLSPVTLMLRKMRADDPDLVVSGKTVGEAARRVAAGEAYGGVSTKPLVDSGHLLQSIDFEVKRTV